LTFNALANTTYMIRVSGYENSRGTFRIKVNNGVFGDVCQTAEVLNIPGTGANFQSLFDKTGCTDESSCGTNDMLDYWHRWTAPSSGLARLSTCIGQTNFNTTLAVFGGACGALTPIVCNDDAAPACSIPLASRVQWNAVAGVTYYIRVASVNNVVGEYDLDLSLASCPGDISGNGVVNVDDLLSIISAWGPCSGCPQGHRIQWSCRPSTSGRPMSDTACSALVPNPLVWCAWITSQGTSAIQASTTSMARPPC